MAAVKLSLSFDAELASLARQAADQEGRSVSSLVAELTAQGLRRRALREAIKAYEDEHGEITAEEMDAARRGVRSTAVGP